VHSDYSNDIFDGKQGDYPNYDFKSSRFGFQWGQSPSEWTLLPTSPSQLRSLIGLCIHPKDNKSMAQSCSTTPDFSTTLYLFHFFADNLAQVTIARLT
jgi:hypothetical protein